MYIYHTSSKYFLKRLLSIVEKTVNFYLDNLFGHLPEILKRKFHILSGDLTGLFNQSLSDYNFFCTQWKTKLLIKLLHKTPI